VSWVDRIWTTFPLVTTLSVMGWASTRGEVACIPRLMLVLALQVGDGDDNGQVGAG
jgi:hypothetical protein